MHRFRLYKYEVLTDDPKVRVFFEEGIIAQPTFEDILQSDSEREGYYRYIIPELYNILHANDPLPGGVDVLTYWMRRKSLEAAYKEYLKWTSSIQSYVKKIENNL